MKGLDEELGSVTKGKQGELIIIGKILLKGHKVYLPVVDTGIDFLVDVGKGNYKEIQVKSQKGGRRNLRDRGAVGFNRQKKTR